MNSKIETALQRLRDVIFRKDLPPDIRRTLFKAVDEIFHGQAEYEDQLQELRERIFRNPAFPDDLVGWLDDDFDLPDDDEDEENH